VFASKLYLLSAFIYQLYSLFKSTVKWRSNYISEYMYFQESLLVHCVTFVVFRCVDKHSVTSVRWHRWVSQLFAVLVQ